jgi:hypothetical protein
VNYKDFAKLIEMMDNFIDDDEVTENRDEYVYEELAEEMAKAASLVYDACIDGQRSAKNQ